MFMINFKLFKNVAYKQILQIIFSSNFYEKIAFLQFLFSYILTIKLKNTDALL